MFSVRIEPFAAFLERRPRVALVIVRKVAERLRYADAQQADFATHDAATPSITTTSLESSQADDQQAVQTRVDP